MRFLLIFSIIVLLVGFKPGKYNIKGTISVKNSGMVCLLDEQDTLAVVPLKKGVFKINRNIETPSVYTLAWGAGKEERMVLFSDGSDLKINVTQKLSVCQGGDLQKAWEQFLTEDNRFKKEEIALEAEYESERKAKNYFGTRIVMAKAEKLDSVRSAMEDKFIRDNDNILGAYLIKRRLREIIRAKQIVSKYEMLGKNALTTSIAKELEPYYKSAKMIAVGSIAPDFTLTSVDGKELSLHGIKAKVKIIDFWASWCGPCRAENPHVKELYEKYKDKGLEIIGVSLDQSKEKWEEAIKKDGLPWLHVSSLKGWGCPVAVEYGIVSIPTVVILNQDNRIVAMKPMPRDLEKILEDLL